MCSLTYWITVKRKNVQNYLRMCKICSIFAADLCLMQKAQTLNLCSLQKAQMKMDCSME